MKKPKHIKIFEALKDFEVGESIGKEDLVLTMYAEYDYFVDRSFSVLFCRTKKMLPEMKFRTIGGEITRVA